LVSGKNSLLNFMDPSYWVIYTCTYIGWQLLIDLLSIYVLPG
jgi:hypothetical protein